MLSYENSLSLTGLSYGVLLIMPFITSLLERNQVSSKASLHEADFNDYDVAIIVAGKLEASQTVERIYLCKLTGTTGRFRRRPKITLSAGPKDLFLWREDREHSFRTV